MESTFQLNGISKYFNYEKTFIDHHCIVCGCCLRTVTVFNTYDKVRNAEES